MKSTNILCSVLAACAALAVSSAAAKDDSLDFLHQMQKEGYADIAIDYLNQAKTDPKTPKEILNLWDLEMSKSKKEAVRLGQVYDSNQAKLWSEESKTLLEKFIKANPNLPEAIQEAAKWSEEKALEAQYDVVKATYTADKAAKAKLLADARKIFDEIRPRFEQAEKASASLLASLPQKATARQRENARMMVGESRLTVAMVDFYLAQTQEAGQPRTDALNKVAKKFDDIYQDFRSIFLGWRAHFWHARILQELGQFSDAKAIYEEVTACDERNVEEVGESRVSQRVRSVRKTGLEDFFADVEQYYLQTLFRLCEKDFKDYLEEATTWRALHKLNSERCYGYQALTLELAKNYLTIGDKSAKEETKKAALTQALKLLGEMIKIQSPYQQDAIKLRRQLNPNASAQEGFEDAVIDGDAAVEKKKWADAADFYEKAISAATAKTDQARLAEAKNTLVGCYHNQALQLYQKGKAEEAVAMAKKALKKELLQTKAAPGVAVFLLNVQYYQYLGAPEKTEEDKKAKQDLLTKVSNTAKQILNIKAWAAKEEGDAARIVLLRLALAQENVAEADKILSEINPSSREYPRALTVMGFAHWFKYKAAKKQIEAEEAQIKANKENKVATDKAKLVAIDKASAKRDEDRKQAVDFTEKAIKALDVPRAADAPLPEALRECQLLLAEIYLEGKDFKQSWSLYKPLIDEILKDSSKPFDDNTLRIFDGAGQACLQLPDVESITTVATKFCELGPDKLPINIRIMSFVRGLENERKKAMAEGDSGDAAGSTGGSRLKSLTELQVKIMINLTKRENLTPASMIWIVKTSNNLGTDESKAAAADLIVKIIDKANGEPEFEQEIKKAKAGLQSLGAIIQAERGQYQKAKELIDQLIQTYPRALEPRISEAKILTEWAAKDPTKYAKAIIAWDRLREKLERLSNTADKTAKKTIDPKYDVILNEAECFYKMSQKTKDKGDAKKGFDVLSPYLNLDPNIRNPSDEYQELSFRYFQVGGKLADSLGVPRPLRPKPKRKL